MSITSSPSFGSWTALLLGFFVAASAHGQFNTQFDGPFDALAMLEQDVSTSAELETTNTPRVETPEEYGTAGSIEWTVGGMVCAEFGITELAVMRQGIDWFVRDRFSLGLQLDVGGAWVGGGGYTGTIGMATIARWHFLQRETWTLFAEVGIGLAWFGAPLPEAGTRLNFSPQAGLGATFRLDDRLRLHVSAGWYHLSNARTSSSNPGFDGLAVQVGIGVGF